jgi:hypothetical protein
VVGVDAVTVDEVVATVPPTEVEVEVEVEVELEDEVLAPPPVEAAVEVGLLQPARHREAAAVRPPMTTIEILIPA